MIGKSKDIIKSIDIKIRIEYSWKLYKGDTECQTKKEI